MEQEILAGLKKMVLNYEIEKAESAAKDATSSGSRDDLNTGRFRQSQRPFS